MRRTAGQAAIEYVVIVGLVAVVMVVGGAVVGGRAIAGVTVRQISRALCIVRSGDCDHARGPCTLRSRRSQNDLHVTAAVIRVGAGNAVLREERSDGTVSLTLVDMHELGGEVSGGAGAKISLGSHALAVGGELRAAALARSGSGTTYVVKNDLQADALLRLLARPKMDPNFATPAIRAYFRRLERFAHAVPVARYHEHGASVQGSASGSAGEILSIHLDGQHARIRGEREDLVTGRRTVYVRRETGGSAGAALLDMGETVSLGSEETLAITYDRQGRPLDLAVVTGGSFTSSADLPPVLQAAAGLIGAKPSSGHSYELEVHLDLTDPANLAAARAQLASFGGRVPDSRVTAELRRRLEEDGIAETRVVENGGSTFGASGHVGGGLLKIGGGFGHTVATTRLLSDLVRGPEGIWTSRTCA